MGGLRFTDIFFWKQEKYIGFLFFHYFLLSAEISFVLI